VKADHGKAGADGRSFLTFDTTPGATSIDHVEVTNFSHKPERLAVYPVDAVPTANGAIGFANQGAPRSQAGAWMAVGTPHGRGLVTLAPRSTQVLPVRVTVPRNAPPGDHVGAVIVSLNGLVAGKFSNSGEKVKFEQRIAIKALFRVSGPLHPLVAIQGLKASYSGPIDPFARGTATVTYFVHNGGNVIFGGPQFVSIHSLFGEHVAAHGVADLPPILPGATYGPVTVRIPRVYPELFMSAKVTVTPAGLQGDIDTGLHPVTASVHFPAIPWILLVVLLLLILGLGWSYERRRRRRKKVIAPSSNQVEPQGASR
jgi:hypothetical protein